MDEFQQELDKNQKPLVTGGLIVIILVLAFLVIILYTLKINGTPIIKMIGKYYFR